MIEHDVENEFDAGTMQFPHHGLEFGDLTTAAAAAGIGLLGREKRHGVIAPIVTQALAAQGIGLHHIIFMKFLHRQ